MFARGQSPQELMKQSIRESAHSEDIPARGTRSWGCPGDDQVTQSGGDRSPMSPPDHDEWFNWCCGTPVTVRVGWWWGAKGKKHSSVTSPDYTLGRDHSFLFSLFLSLAQHGEGAELAARSSKAWKMLRKWWGTTIPPLRPCSAVCRQVLSSHPQTEFTGLERFVEISAASTVQVTVLPVMDPTHSVQLSDIWLLHSHLYLLTCFCFHLLIFLLPAGFNSLYPVKLMDRLGNHVLLKKETRKSNVLPGRF